MQCPLCCRVNRPDARFCDACGVCLTAQAADEAAGALVVGREAELAALADLVGRMVNGHGAIVALVGEPGIGKSHTAKTLARRATGVRTPSPTPATPERRAPRASVRRSRTIARSSWRSWRMRRR